MFVVYALVDPRNRRVRYVGRTKKPMTRFLSYRYVSRGQNIGRTAWIERLHEKHLAPLMLLLEVCADRHAPDVEAKWIAHYRERGKIYNGHDRNKLQIKPSYTTRREWTQ